MIRLKCERCLYCHAVFSLFPSKSRHVFAVHGHPILHEKNKFRGKKLRVIVTREREREMVERVRCRGHLFTGHPRRYPKFRVLVSGRLLGRALKNRRVVGNIDLQRLPKRWRFVKRWWNEILPSIRRGEVWFRRAFFSFFFFLYHNEIFAFYKNPRKK